MNAWLVKERALFGTVPSMTRSRSARDVGSSLAVCLVGACFVAACTTSSVPPTTPTQREIACPVALPRIDGVEWICVELRDGNGRPVALADRPPTLLIGADGRASGFAGVNRYFAEAKVGNTITAVTPYRFGPVGATRMAGSPENMAIEHAYTTMLETVRFAVVTGESRGPMLTLRDERGDCARFVPAPSTGESK
jgi:heat shock protein HslJ